MREGTIGTVEKTVGERAARNRPLGTGEHELNSSLESKQSTPGGRYPDGLKGSEIPLGARIFTVADTLDAMTSDRSYRKGPGFEAAQSEIAKGSGSQFDPHIAALFLKIPSST